MAKNDLVLLDGILEQRVRDAYPSGQPDGVFEFFALEQLLKDYDLSREEIDGNWIDGRDDGGIDGFFTLVNGHLLQDPDAFAWPKRSAEIEVWIITCKHHATFQQAPLNSLLASLPEILDLSLETGELRGKYSDALVRVRSLFLLAYRRLASVRPTLSFRFAYVSRGDSADVAGNVRARGDRILALVHSLFSSCLASFDFVGAPELVERYRRTKRFSLDLPFLECLAREQASYILLTRLDEYCRFVKDEHGQLRRYLFDSNVRDYLGDNRVNEDIAESLRDPMAPDFWWLNNGVTILATAATILGKTIHLQDIQIVNGLQTTECVFRHFQSRDTAAASRALLIKVVVSTDTAVRDRIIHATNNQSVVEPASLHATDKIQRDIEDILERHAWFYERRKNYYRNIGKPAARFVTPMYIAAGYVGLILKNPSVAARLKSRFMRHPEGYSMVFSHEVPLDLWPILVEILKRVEDGLSLVRAERPGAGERFLANWRNLVALLSVARVIGRFSYSVEDFLRFDVSSITRDLVLEMWGLVEGTQRSGYERAFKSKPFANRCCAAAAAAYGLEGVEVVGRRTIATGPGKVIVPPEDLIERVDSLLPSQPWKVGVHIRVASQLSCKASLVCAAIQELIARGKRLNQRDGVVYDKDGKIVAVDPDRVKKNDSSSESQ